MDTRSNGSLHINRTFPIISRLFLPDLLMLLLKYLRRIKNPCRWMNQQQGLFQSVPYSECLAIPPSFLGFS